MSFTADLDEIVAKNENGLLRVHETWERVPAGFVVSILNGFPFDSKHFEKGGGVPLIRIRDILDSSTEVGFTGPIPDGYWIKRGDILIGMDGDFNVSHWKGSEALLNQRVCKISVDERFFQSNFFFHSVAGYLKAINEYTSSVTVKHLSSKTIAEIPLPLPPINEQKRIADKLDAILARVNACRESLERVPAILKRFRQAVLAAATSGTLTEEWRVMRTPPNSETMSHWQKIALGDLCESSFYGPRFGKDEYTQSNAGVPTIRTTDMTRDGRIEITKDTPKVVVPQDKVEHFRVQKGDLLVTRTGSIGVMAVFEDDYLAIPSAYLIRFRFSPQVLPRYVFYCLMAPDGQEYLGLSATAITQPNVNAEAIKRIKVQLPSIDEQHEIVHRVEALFTHSDRLEARYTAARAQVERLTPALLAKAFRGELVPQDPNDEPASALLERIRASRAAAGEKPTRKARSERKPMTTTPTTDTLKEIIRGLPTDHFTFDDLRRQVSADYETLKDLVFALLSEAPASVKQVFDTEAKTMGLVRVT